MRKIKKGGREREKERSLSMSALKREDCVTILRNSAALINLTRHYGGFIKSELFVALERRSRRAEVERRMTPAFSLLLARGDIFIYLRRGRAAIRQVNESINWRIN